MIWIDWLVFSLANADQRFLFQNNDEVMKKKSPLRIAPFLLLSLFLLLLVVGINVGEPERVLEQAKTICLACIGIG